jgi:hypothetical protein
VFVGDQLLELEEAVSQEFTGLDPAHSNFKRWNLLIAAGIADPLWPKDSLRRDAHRRELEQLRTQLASRARDALD